MPRVAIGKRHAALIAKMADGVVDVDASLLGLIRAKPAGGRGEPAQVVVSKRAARDEEKLLRL